VRQATPLPAPFQVFNWDNISGGRPIPYGDFVSVAPTLLCFEEGLATRSGPHPRPLSHCVRRGEQDKGDPAGRLYTPKFIWVSGVFGLGMGQRHSLEKFSEILEQIIGLGGLQQRQFFIARLHRHCDGF
jgi:hypothetical protein